MPSPNLPFSSLLFRAVRPYADLIPRFMAAHELARCGVPRCGDPSWAAWQASALRALAKNPPHSEPRGGSLRVISATATLTVVLAFFTQVLTGPPDMLGRYPLLV